MKLFLNLLVLVTIVLCIVVFSFIFLGGEEQMLDVKENNLFKYIFRKFCMNLFIICIGSILLFLINRFIFEVETDLNYYKKLFIILNLISILVITYIYII
jgi:hypothetical protein